jgi:riboflavin kinase / FMN adenylyltransferase
MKIYNNIDEFTRLENAVVTIGTFDGVHIGHQKIISRLLEITRQTSGESVILTFFPHPRMILHPEDVNIKLINTISEKATLLEEAGIDHLIITPFTRDFSNLSPEEYIRSFLINRIGTRRIVIGYDHRFGKDRSGGLQQLQQFSSEYGFEVEEIPEQDIHDVAVSSTKIRQALLSGDIETANDFLGYPFSITGKVIKGDQIGRQLGFPTANLFVEETYKLIPSDGIYAVDIKLKTSAAKLKGMAYIGHRPTLNGMSRNIEVNIFDFSQDIYGETISLYFLNFIRSDQKFNSLEELTGQLKKDEMAVRLLS